MRLDDSKAASGGKGNQETQGSYPGGGVIELHIKMLLYIIYMQGCGGTDTTIGYGKIGLCGYIKF